MNIRKFRITNTIAEIEYSDEYDEHFELFSKGVEILKSYLNNDDDFSDEDREILEDIHTIMNVNN